MRACMWFGMCLQHNALNICQSEKCFCTKVRLCLLFNYSCLSTFITLDNQEHNVVRYGVKFLNWHWLLSVVKVKLSLCLTNQAPWHEGIWDSECTDPCFLDLSTSWTWMVSFTPRMVYPQDPLDRRLGGPQSQSGQHGEEKILDPPGTPTSRSSSL
jgi:hypothetical protein